MKLHWLIPGTFMTLFMLSLPVDAAKLKSWHYDAHHSQLEINTEGNVQPLLEAEIRLPDEAEALSRRGTQVAFTRNSGHFVSLVGKPEMAERDYAEVFVSVYANSAGEDRPDANGLEVYYYDSGLDLARVVGKKSLPRPNTRESGIRRAISYVPRKTSMPSILVAIRYVTRKENMAKLKTLEYQNQPGEALPKPTGGATDTVLKYVRGK